MAASAQRKSPEAVPSGLLISRGAWSRNRTGTPSRAVDFESTASTDSATQAREKGDYKQQSRSVKRFQKKLL